MIPDWINRKTLAWAFYDFADTAFSALFITFFFPILIKVHLMGTEFHVGLAMGLSVLLAGLLVPLLGAISDASGRRMPILIFTTILTAALTVLAGYAGLTVALILGALANVAHLADIDIYDAKMIDIVPRSLYGSLSGLGVALGYAGTIAALAVGYPLLSYFGWEKLVGIRAVFWEAAAFYIIFSLPLFLLVPDKIRPATVAFRHALKKGLAEIKHTLTNLPRFPVFSRFLLASFCYNNGMNTVIIFLALYGREVIGLGVQQFFPVFALMALAAGAGSMLFGRLSDRFGPIKMVKTALWLWIAIIIFLIFITSYASFLIAGMLGGAALGAIWTLNRHMVAASAPERKIAEFFGFEGLTEKFSGVLGPVVFGFIVTLAGEGNEVRGYQNALVSMLVFFAVGLWFLRKIPRNVPYVT